MANGDTGSHTNGMDHDFLAAFLGGEIERKHSDSVHAPGLQFPGVEGEDDAVELHEEKDHSTDSDPTDGGPTCSKCCDDFTVGGQCLSRAPHCQTHERHCHHKKEEEPPRHASWFDRH